MHEQAHFAVISGGMITGPRIGPIGEVAGYIQQAYKDVEQATGVKFGEKFLTETLAQGTAIFTSIPPAIALSVFKTHLPEQAVAFAGTLQKPFTTMVYTRLTWRGMPPMPPRMGWMATSLSLPCPIRPLRRQPRKNLPTLPG